jgi:hypothetical protein
MGEADVGPAQRPVFDADFLAGWCGCNPVVDCYGCPDHFYFPANALEIREAIAAEREDICATDTSLICVAITSVNGVFSENFR